MVRGIYRALRVYGDAKALAKGPVYFGKRLARRQVHRRVHSKTATLLRRFGL